MEELVYDFQFSKVLEAIKEYKTLIKVSRSSNYQNLLILIYHHDIIFNYLKIFCLLLKSFVYNKSNFIQLFLESICFYN